MFAVVYGQHLFATGVANTCPGVLFPVFVMSFDMLVQLAHFLEGFSADFTPERPMKVLNSTHCLYASIVELPEVLDGISSGLVCQLVVSEVMPFGIRLVAQIAGEPRLVSMVEKHVLAQQSLAEEHVRT